MAQRTDADILAYLDDPSRQERGYRLLVQTYQERLYWHIRRMVGTHEDADDVLQNTFVKVFKNMNRFERKSNLYTWLYRIATNESLTFLRKKNRNHTDSMDDEAFSGALKLYADTYLDGDAARRQLQKALAQLPEKQRLVFELRYYDEMTYRAISEVLETSEGALKANYHHAVKKIEHFIRNTDMY